MSRAFDYINGDKVDLKDEVHRQIVIDRNKSLEKSLKEGLSLCKVTVNLDLSLDCVKCGNTLNVSEYDFDIDSLFSGNIVDELPSLKCKECATSYRFTENEFAEIGIKVIQRKSQKAKRK